MMQQKMIFSLAFQLIITATGCPLQCSKACGLELVTFRHLPHLGVQGC